MIHKKKFREYIAGGVVIGATLGMAAALGGGQYVTSAQSNNFVSDINEVCLACCPYIELGKSLGRDMLIGGVSGAACGGLVGAVLGGAAKLFRRK